MSEPPSSRPAAPADRPLDGARNANPAGIGFWALVAEDYATHGRDPLSQGFWALFWHQFGNWPMPVRPWFLRLPLTLLYRIMTKLVPPGVVAGGEPARILRNRGIRLADA